MAITNVYVNDAGSGATDGTSEANAISWATMITGINAGGKAGNCYLAKGAITRTTNTDTISGSGTATSPVTIRGYGTVITDGYLGRTNGNGPLILTNLPAVTYTTGRLNISGDFIECECLNVAGAPSAALVTVSNKGGITQCKVDNSSTNGSAVAIQGNTTGSAASVIYNNDAILSGASGGSAAIINGSQSRIVGNRVKGGPGIGIILTTNTNQCVCVDNLVYGCTGVGIRHDATTNSPHFLHGNTVVGGTSDGINFGSGASTMLLMVTNNMITDNGGYGINGISAANAIFFAHNRTRDNTSGAINLATDWATATKYGHVTTDTGGAETDYVNAASQDYSLIPISPAINAGQFLYRAIGAFQYRVTTGIINRITNIFMTEED